MCPPCQMVAAVNATAAVPQILDGPSAGSAPAAAAALNTRKSSALRRPASEEEPCIFKKKYTKTQENQYCLGKYSSIRMAVNQSSSNRTALASPCGRCNNKLSSIPKASTPTPRPLILKPKIQWFFSNRFQTFTNPVVYSRHLQDRNHHASFSRTTNHGLSFVRSPISTLFLCLVLFSPRIRTNPRYFHSTTNQGILLVWTGSRSLLNLSCTVGTFSIGTSTRHLFVQQATD